MRDHLTPSSQNRIFATGMNDWTLWALYYLLLPATTLQEQEGAYGILWEERETEELVAFVRLASREMERRGLSPPRPVSPDGRPVQVRITRTLRIFVGNRELLLRPMAKSVLLLFLKHPEGIVLKDILDYGPELSRYYRRVSRSSSPAEIDARVLRVMDLFNNELSVHIARVNAAVKSLVGAGESRPYQIRGSRGNPKSIPLDRNLVHWE